MKFVHMADCHIGGWKEAKLRRLNMDCFKEAIKISLEKNVDFILISGDLFNTSLPQIDYIKEVTAELKKVKDSHIPIYIVAGSHDFSPSGKTMLDVLENAGLVKNVMCFDSEKLCFTVDPKTGAKIVGMYGKRGGLEIKEYKAMQYSHLEQEEGFKIFLFHTAINEFKPQELELMPGANAATLPKGFHYYAGGHVHYVFQKEFGQGWLTYPGALFPNNFKEVEEWQHGGVYIVDEEAKWEYVPIRLKDVVTFNIDVDGLSPEAATQKLSQEVKLKDTHDKIVTLRVVGEVDGKSGDVNFQEVMQHLQNSYHVLRNTAKLRSKMAKTFAMRAGTVDEIEREIMRESNESTMDFAKMLMHALDKEKGEGEKVADFEKRVVLEGLQVLEIETKEDKVV
tara:strand:+ start:543 stop:1727 length:1185 start_codon:yes stop_codon:yes gene_type:complete